MSVVRGGDDSGCLGLYLNEVALAVLCFVLVFVVAVAETVAVAGVVTATIMVLQNRCGGV